ncbi:rho GTPase-activating protein SYDE1 isoform X2 [Esox lucius]|uniref:rho GTPase-activating protein SYDE1 isoform X2 n=1 Tax=Esox lucius TaxID=8010 RepID=UPI0014774129|nr:rho GTPase-activating protein SYDE1 isoform X2 [Esox lucius]
MAEPLLKRTFSRLRGKDRSRRKTDPKLNDLQGTSDVIQSSSSSSLSTLMTAETEPPTPPAEETSTSQRTQITVAKKQQWAKLASVPREPAPPSTEGAHTHGLVYGAGDWDSCSGKALASAPKQAWSQKTLAEAGLDRRRCGDLDWELQTHCSTSSRNIPPPVHTPVPELTMPVGGYADECLSSSSTLKSSGSGAYLQTLDRSSRAWVLSTGKSQAADEASTRLGLLPNCLTELRQRTEGENNIWYNPIPEEEDILLGIRRLGGAGGGGVRLDTENPWKRRETEGLSDYTKDSQVRSQRWAGLLGSTGGSGGASRLERHATQCPSGGSSPGSAHRTKDITGDGSFCGTKDRDSPDVIQQVQFDDLRSAGAALGGVPGAAGDAPLTSDIPGAQKKGGGASSVMDRIKSPGTVRKSLSMKMKKLPELRRKLSLRSSRSHRHGKDGAGGGGGGDRGGDGTSPPDVRKEQSNEVISRYHLDTSAPARPQRRSSRGRSSRAASKGGYLSDGDSPELLPKQGQGQPPSAHSTPPPAPHSGQEGVATTSDLSSFRVYRVSEQPRCAQRVSGLLTVHLVGVEELLRSPRQDASKEVFCAIQVDGVTKARTGLLTSRGGCLPLNHTFNLELERARVLKLVVLTPHPGATKGSDSGATRNRVCCLGAVSIPPLFKASRTQQLCVSLEPRGLLYVKLTLLEQWDPPSPRPCDLNPPNVFGVELCHLVDKEDTAAPIPLLIQKSVAEIEKRGLRVVGLYRLCGSAAVKKELRDAFERDSAAVTLNEELYPDINVITGILKDYLRELPSPLITRTLYEVVLEAMSRRPPPPRTSPGSSSLGRSEADVQRSMSTVALLQCLPEPERATLSLLLDHLSLVASFSDCNRMNCQNLSVCFGPVLLTPTQESWRPVAPGQGGQSGCGGSSGRAGRSFTHSEEIASAVDFKRHIEVLHYLLQLWPIPPNRLTDGLDTANLIQPSSGSDPPPSPPRPTPHNPLRRRCQRGPPLRLDLPGDEVGVVSRRGRGRLESPPCNRYAGDWSVCGRDFLSGGEADYDEVAGSDSDEEVEVKKVDWTPYVDDLVLDFDAPFTCRLSLKDFDTLISDLERELSKQINICL